MKINWVVYNLSVSIGEYRHSILSMKVANQLTLAVAFKKYHPSRNKGGKKTKNIVLLLTRNTAKLV